MPRGQYNAGRSLLQGWLCVDVRQDKDLKSWFDEFFEYALKSLDEPGYA